MTFYEKNRTGIIKDCNTFLAQCKDKDKWFDTLVEGGCQRLFRMPRWVGRNLYRSEYWIWDLLTIAYSDKDYRPEEKAP